MKNLPDKFLDNMKLQLPGKEFEAFLAGFTEKPVTGLRANSLKIPPKKLPGLLGEKLDCVPWCTGGFYYDDNVFRPAKSPFYNAGLFYIQEPSAMLPASLLDVRENDKVLDLCAAPGGKATQLAEKLRSTGVIFANEVNAGRIPPLIKNCALFGLKNCIISNETPEKLADALPEYFDRILVDAPCSGEGMFRKDDSAIGSWRRFGPESVIPLQKHILSSAARLLKPGGMIAYSTCTFNENENERMIENFLKTHDGFRIIEVKRLYPHKHRGEGHFAAIIAKDGEGGRAVTPRAPKKIPGVEYFYDFANQYCGNLAETASEPGRLELRKEALYLLPKGLPSLDGLRVKSEGLFLGMLRQGRFEPSYALAMSLKASEFSEILDFDPTDSRLTGFLVGQTQECDGNGLKLVCCGGFPVSFGKIVNGRLKLKK